MSEANVSEIIELLSQGDNALLGKSIVDAWDEIKCYVTLEFWKELEERLNGLSVDYPAFKTISLQRFSKDHVRGMFFGWRGREREFGLIANLCPFHQSPTDAIALNVETAEGDKLYFGLTVVRDEVRRDVSAEPVFAALADQFDEYSDRDFRNDCWLGGKYFKSKNIDLSQFHNEDTIALVNEQKRKAAIESLYGEIVDFLKICRIKETLAATPVTA